MLFTPRQNHASQSQGNRSNLFFQPRVQTKLEVDAPDSAAEKEADHTADKVVQRSSLLETPTETFFSPAVQVQRKPELENTEPENAESESVIQESSDKTSEQQTVDQPPVVIQQKPEAATVHTSSVLPIAVQPKKEDEGKDNEKEEEEETEEPVQLKVNGERNTSGDHLSEQITASKGGGEELAEPVKQEMQQGFGADFSNVRIHRDSNASGMNKELGAQAFTNGNDIYFNEGKYNTNSKEGKHLLAHELTHTIQQGAAGQSIQRKPEDYEHPEDGNQSMDGINEEVVDELGEDKNIRNPQISADERAESRPPQDEKGDGVDKDELENSAKPDVDRKEETQPQINETLQKTSEELNNVEAPEEPEEKEITKKEKKLSPKEQALVNAKKAYTKANREPEKVETTPVEIPEIKRPKDAAGNELEGNPEAEVAMMGIVGKIQLLREQAAALKEGADQEKINAEMMRGDIQVMYHGVYTSDEFIDKAGKHTESRKEGVEGMKEQLVDSKARTEQVTTGLPNIQEQAEQGKEESGPMAESSQERKQANDNLNTDDEDARADAEERGQKLNSTDRDAQNIDDAITQARDKGTQMAEQAVVATQNNTETETTIGEMDTQIALVEEKLTADTAINTSAKTQLDSLSPEPDVHKRQAFLMEERADEKLRQSDELEEQLHETYDEYHERMADVQPDPTTALQAKMEDGNTVPDIQLVPEDGNQSPAQQQQEQHNNWFAEQVRSMDSVTDEEVAQMHFYEKAWFGLRRTYYDIRSSLSQVNWGRFTEDLLRGLVDPVFLIQSMGELFNSVTHPRHRPGEDPITYLLREAAGWATAIAITFGLIAGLCLIGMGVLAVVNFWFPPTLIWSPPIYAELGALMSWSGSMLWATTQVALVLHALVFISDLIATAFSETAGQLVNNSRQMRTDVDAATFPILTAATVGLFEFVGGALRRTGVVRPNTPGEGVNPASREGVGTTETPVVGDEVRPNEESPVTTEPVSERPNTSDGENTGSNRTNPPEENRPGNTETANTVDGLEVREEFRGDDGHTRKVLEDGQVARCTFCVRCRVQYATQLLDRTLLSYLEHLEAKFRVNPTDATLQPEQLAFESDLQNLQNGTARLEDIRSRYETPATPTGPGGISYIRARLEIIVDRLNLSPDPQMVARYKSNLTQAIENAGAIGERLADRIFSGRYERIGNYNDFIRGIHGETRAVESSLQALNKVDELIARGIPENRIILEDNVPGDRFHDVDVGVLDESGTPGSYSEVYQTKTLDGINSIRNQLEGASQQLYGPNATTRIVEFDLLTGTLDELLANTRVMREIRIVIQRGRINGLRVRFPDGTVQFFDINYQF